MKDSFGARLKFFRSKAGLSQQELAKKTGLSRKMISDYEVKLDLIPRDSNLYKIAEALDVDSSNLIPKTKGGAVEGPDGRFSITYNLHEFPKKLIEVLEKIANEKNVSIQDAFDSFMHGVLEKHLKMSDEEREASIKKYETTKLELDEKSFSDHLDSSE